MNLRQTQKLLNDYILVRQALESKIEPLKEKYDWSTLARDKQLAPSGNWGIWMVLAGRGFGKTRTGAEWIRSLVENSKEPLRIALVGNTPADVRDVMIEGESGILGVSPPWFKPTYEPSKRRLTWPNGSIATTYSYQNPDQLRGPQHHYAWCDELVNADDEEVWDNLMLGLRIGDYPKVLITTTPKPKALIKKLVADKKAVVTKGNTYENKANLSDVFIQAIEEKYEGTRLGRQELYAEVLADVEGALWTYACIEQNRLRHIDKESLSKIVVAVDPAASNQKESDETGIVVCGCDKQEIGYVLEDATIKGSPYERACQIKRVFEKWEANYIVAEQNNGGDMVEYMIKTVDDKNKMVVKLVHASRGKVTRAEPIAALSEQDKIKFVGGELSKLEDELCTWEPGAKSPNRLDAMVWGFTDLLLKRKRITIKFSGL